MAGNFMKASRLARIPLEARTRPTGGGVVTGTLPKTGFLAGLLFDIEGAVAGSLSAPNALGFSSIISRLRVQTNSAIDLFSVSGAGYAYLLDEALETEYFRAQGQNEGRTAVTATTFNLSMYVPIAINLRDPVGLVMLQNEQTVVSYSIDFLADASVATGATVTATVKPTMLYYTVPTRAEDFPRLDILHTIIEDQNAVSASGDYTYNLPRGYTYLQMLHGLGIGVSGSDGWSRIRERINQNTYTLDDDTDVQDQLARLTRGRARVAGAINVDYVGMSGFGSYGQWRDAINSRQVTDLAHVITATGAGTLYSIRRMLIPLS
jgi:hypothetical protein